MTTTGRRGPGLGLGFAGVSLLAVLALGVVLGDYLRGLMHAQSLAQATRTGELVERLIAERVGTAPFTRPLAPADRQFLDGLTSSRTATGLGVVRLWDAGGQVRYDSAGLLGGTWPAPSEGLRRAYRGGVVAEESTGSTSPQVPGPLLLKVYVPVHDTPGGPVIGAMEAHLPYAQTAAEAKAAVRQLRLALGAGLTGLWLLTCWLAFAVNRRLRRQAEGHSHLARHDALTGLPNRRALMAASETAIAACSPVEPVALLLLDLDRFKEVNDCFGHQTGDRLLVQVGGRLLQRLPGAMVTRLGGDEFAVLLPGVGPAGARRAAARLAGAFDDSFVLDDLLLDVQTSIGVAVAPFDGDSAQALLQRADVAMYNAKRGRSTIALYAAADDLSAPNSLALAGDLRHALGTQQLRLEYQPTWDLRYGGCTLVEALVRWDHPTLGPVSPADFVPIAESTGLIRPLTRLVLDESLRQVRAWADAGVDLHLAVNLSARNLAEDDLPDVLAELLRRHRVPAGSLVLEITESAVIPDPERAGRVLARLVALGAEISLDDFGTGWSSMSRLLELPLTALKIDRSFVADLPSGPGAAIVAATIALGHQLNLFVVAEGVETPAQLARLVELDCDVAQGFLLGKPMRPAEVPAAVLNGRVRPHAPATASVREPARAL